VYEFLGMKVGYVLGRMERDEKRNMYSADVVYLTSSQSAFDYMIDNMVWSLADKMQTKGLNHAIVDEGDSVLIDESRTPNIISGSSDRLSHNYLKADKIVKLLSSEDFKLDKEDKQVFLTPAGIARVETEFGIDNLFSADNAIYFHVIQNSLRAVKLLKKDVDYIVSYDFEKKAKKIVLIDKFTGRILPNRSYSNGLQQAVQAKEGVEIEPETVIRASTTYQNYFRLFKHLSAMTGTAKTEEKEFYEIYRLKTFVIPTNKPMIRTDDADVICINKAYKLESLAEKVKKYHSKGQPVLIGTVSIESSEEVAAALRKVGIFKFELLNAKNHKREAEIVKFAGQKGIITIATNMAGRGTDIVLGPGIAELGGLVVFGTERNEARRIDNQLRGRSGRQGDPGYSRFFVSFEDELPSRFAGDTLKRFISRFFMKDTKIVSPSISRSFDSMQERMEAINFDIRKNLLDYDNVVSQHRTLIYK